MSETNTISVTYTVPSERLAVWNSILSLKKGSPDFLFDREISVFEVPLQDGYSADFSLVNGDKESGPYLDVVFSLDGQEVNVLPPGFEKLDGSYTLVDHSDGTTFVLSLQG